MSIVDILKLYREPVPTWLRQPFVEFNREQFFGFRTVYYPGSGDDGQPIKLCARAHVAHTFVYVDYGVSEAEVTENLCNNERKFRGYSVKHSESLDEAIVFPQGFEARRPYFSQPLLYGNEYTATQPFVRFVVLHREDNFDETHGPERLAVMFIGRDGHATYEVLYCQNVSTPKPYMVVVQDHRAFTVNCSPFGMDGRLSKIAQECNVFPKWLLIGSRSSPKNGEYTVPWNNYQDTGATPEPGGQKATPRRLFLHRQILGSV